MEKFMKWLRHKKNYTIRYFEAESECKWKCNNNVDKHYIQKDDNEYDDHVHDESN